MVRRLAYRAAAALVPAGLALPILRGPLRGRRWIAGAAAGEGKGLSVLMNLAEPAQLAAAQRLAGRDGVCFDIGANVGLYTLLLSRHARHVFAFEPLPRNVQYLARLIEVNRLGNVTVVPWAVSEATGLRSFRLGENCALGRLDEGGEQPVAAVSCDDFVRRYGAAPTLMKIDVEGAEAEVLRGAAGVLREHRPAILLSTHGPARREESLAILRQHGYTRLTPLNAEGGEASEFAAEP